MGDENNSQIMNEIAKIKEELVSEHRKLPNLNIESNIVEKKKPFEMPKISWKTYRGVSIGILFISLFLANFFKQYFETQTTDPYLIMIINILMVFFIFNLGIFLFYKTYYKYITSLKGVTGITGPRGKKGIPGENDVCDISTKKIGNFYRDKKLIKKEIITLDDHFDDSTVIDYDKLAEMKTGWYNIKPADNTSKITNNIIGIECSVDPKNPENNFCNKFSKQKIEAEEKRNVEKPVYDDTGEKNYKEVSINDKPIIGAMVNYNKNTNKVSAIQYLYDRNKNHNKQKYNVGNFGVKGTDINAGTIGDYKNQSDGIERHNFECPANSAIYKVEGVYDNLGIRGVKFHCQDITTGKLVKAYDTNNRKVYGVIFGVEPNPGSEDYHYDKSECTMYKHDNKYYPTFISNIGGEYDRKKKTIQNLHFNKCSFYYDE